MGGKRFRNAVKVYLSEDFDGVMEQVNIESATWTDMDGGLKVPLLNMDAAGYQHGKVENVNVDLTDYGNKPFLLLSGMNCRLWISYWMKMGSELIRMFSFIRDWCRL